MRKANRFALLAAGLVVLAVLLLVLWPARQVGQTAQVGAGEPATAAAALALPTPNSPLPSATAPALPEPATPPPDATPVDWTGISDIPVVQFSELTPAPLTPEPPAPPTPLPEDTLVRDPHNTLSIVAPKGWYAFFSQAGIWQGEAVLVNYDESMEGSPENAISIHFGIETLKEGQTFEQRVVERRELETHPEYGLPATFITDPQPITVASYSGVTYNLGAVMEDGKEQTVQWIFLPVDNRWIFGIAIYASSSPDFEKAVSIFETLNITPHEQMASD